MPKKRALTVLLISLLAVIGLLLFLMFSPIPAPQSPLQQELNAGELAG